MHYLIVGTLHEGRVDVAERNQALSGHPCGKGDRMLLGDAHVKGTVRHGRHHQVHGRSRRHGWSDPHDAGIFFSHLHQGMSKDILVLGRLWAARSFLVNLSCKLIKGAWCMPGGFISTFSRSIALAFYGYAMEDFRTWDILEVS